MTEPSTDSGAFRQLIDAAPDAMVVIDERGRIVYANRQTVSLFGWEPAELVGKSIEVLVPSRFRDAHVAHRSAFIESPHARPMGSGLELFGLRKDGTELSVEVSLAPVSTPAGRLVSAAVRDVSDRKAATEALRESEEKLRDLFEQASDGIFVADLDGKYTAVNGAACAMLGYSRDELLGKTIVDLIPPHDVERLWRTREDLSSGETRTDEWTLRRKDGSDVPVEVSARILPDGRWQAFVRDISVRRGAELVASRLAAIVDSSADAILSKTLDGTILSWNRAAEKIFGYSADEAIGRKVSLLVPPDRAGEEQDLLRRVGAGEHVEHFETVRRRKDGRDIDVSITLSPIRGSAGAVTSASTIARDVTDRKHAEEAVRRYGELLKSAVESFQGAFAVFDSDDRLFMCNSTYRATFGGAVPGNIVGMRYEDIVSANVDRGAVSAEVAPSVLAHHRAPASPVDVRLADGRTFRVVDRPTRDGGSVSTAWDISDDVRQAEELRIARAAAEAASSAKSEFLSSMSHELRTPLNAILGFAQLLERDKKAPLNPRQLERLSHVIRGGEHLLRLIDDVLDLARIETGRIVVSVEPVSVPEVLTEVKKTLEPMAGRNEIRLRIDPVPADLPIVEADRTRLSQILMNYGSNAIKYGRSGGTATFGAAFEGGHVRVSVRDDGVGVPLDKQESLFQPFQRAGQETGPIEGTGIGLAISKRLAEIMGGAVGFESTPGAGSVFWVDLRPHAVDSVEPRPVRAEPSPEAAEGAAADRRLVIYVEDNPSNIAFMEDFLSDLEHVTLLTAPTAEIGIELVRSHGPDVVIMDINLPGISGLEAVRRLRADPETADVPVVGLSAAAMIRDAERVSGAGFYKYLTKPVKLDELTTVLEEIFAHRPPRCG